MTTLLRKAALVYAEDVRQDVRGFALEMLIELDRLEVMRGVLHAALDEWEAMEEVSHDPRIDEFRLVAGVRVGDRRVSAPSSHVDLRAGLAELMLDAPGGDIESNREWRAAISKMLARASLPEREIVDKTPGRCTYQRHAQVGGTHEWCDDPHATPGEPCALHLGHIGSHVTGFGDAGWSGANRPADLSRVDVELVAQARKIAEHWIDQEGVNAGELDKLARIVDPTWAVHKGARGPGRPSSEVASRPPCEGLAIPDREPAVPIFTAGTSDARHRCGLKHAAEAASFAETHHVDLLTECHEHGQIEDVRACDGAHCHRSCDGLRRAECRARWTSELKTMVAYPTSPVRMQRIIDVGSPEDRRARVIDELMWHAFIAAWERFDDREHRAREMYIGYKSGLPLEMFAKLSALARGEPGPTEIARALREACRIALDHIHECDEADNRIRELIDVADRYDPTGKVE